MAAARRPFPLADRQYVDSRSVPVNELNEDAFTLDRFHTYTTLIDSRNRDTSIFPSANRYQVRLPKALTQVRDVKMTAFQFPVPKSDTGLSRTQRTVPLVVRPPFTTTVDEFVATPAYAILADITYSPITLREELQKALTNFVTLVFVPSNANGVELNLGGASSIALLQPAGTAGMLVPDTASINRLRLGNIMYHFSIAATPELTILVVSPTQRLAPAQIIQSASPGVTTTYVTSTVLPVAGDELRLQIEMSVSLSLPFVGLDVVLAFAAGRSSVNRADSLASGLLGFIDQNQILSVGHQTRFPPFESNVPAALAQFRLAGVFEQTIQHFRLFSDAVYNASGAQIEEAFVDSGTHESTLVSMITALRENATQLDLSTARTTTLYPNQNIANPEASHSSQNSIHPDWWNVHSAYVPGARQIVSTGRSSQPFMRNNTLLVPPANADGQPGVMFDYPIPNPTVNLAGLEGALNTTGVNTTIYVAHYRSSYASRIVVDSANPLVAFKVFFVCYPWTQHQDQLGKLVAVRLTPEELATVRSSDRLVVPIVRPKNQGVATINGDPGPLHINKLRQLLVTVMSEEFLLLPRTAQDDYSLLHMFPISATAGPLLGVTTDGGGVTERPYESFNYANYVPVAVVDGIFRHRWLEIDAGVPVVLDIDQNVMQRPVMSASGVQPTIFTSVLSAHLQPGANLISQNGSSTRVVNIDVLTATKTAAMYTTLRDIFTTRYEYSLELQHTFALQGPADPPFNIPDTSDTFFGLLHESDGSLILERLGTLQTLTAFRAILASPTIPGLLEAALVDYYAAHAFSLLTLLQETAQSDSSVAAAVVGTRQAFKTGVDVPYFLVRISGMDNIEVARPVTNVSDNRDDSLYMDNVFAQIRIDDTNADLIVNTASYAESKYTFKPALSKLDKLSISIVRPNGALMDFNEGEHNFMLEFHAQSR